jgi:chromosome segregation ATPase
MSQEKLPVIVARIDERTAHIQEDVKELKSTCTELKTTVGKHSEDLATIKERINSSNCNSTTLTRKQKISAGGVIVTFVTAVIATITEYFRHH